ncbi:hypothetical protein QYE76_038577 [Lolium multiflorum]|uniref:RING-type domain-containing protein n=1 Tax=Lolium multiflorum TaxID=4521 RepID=A0AAD8T9H4_LOLMU|nr:hypothetical protein QYE76_038577 [Lolium multiflorum]
MASPPPPAGPGQEEVEMVSGEASLPLHAAETGTEEDGGPPSDSEEGEADGSGGGEDGDDMDEDEDGGGSNDNDGEEEEEDMDYSSGSSQEPDEEQLAAHLEIWENLQTKMEESGDGMEHRNPAVASCCVCMEPWTSGGAHRICCIPCGHVYGRSCLEKWLGGCGGTMAKCPQCGESFEHKMIINLYGTEYLWNDCIHDQERIAEFERRQLEAFEERMAALREERQEELLAALAAHQEKLTEMLALNEARCHETFTALAAQRVEQQAMWHQMFTAYCAAQGLPPPSMPTLPPHRSPHTHHPSDAGSNEPGSSRASPHDNPLDSSPPS